MEFDLKNKDGAIPCWVVADNDNGRYMIREEDTSGEVFNDPTSMLLWIENNWDISNFENKTLFLQMVKSLQQVVEEKN
ncbi:hypothetical protein [Metabacillus litoralis]|uniref:hypothetical protein n=1 Tax=Metabacillus litoralis TaxID=152268 RepID=UPI001CFC7A3A|nr:hypothetical protein [Metabacillus litoralis]